MLYYSPCGGTGSGLGSLISERLDTSYPKVTKIGYELFPNHITGKSDSIVEPFNFVFNSCSMMSYTDLHIYSTNESI